jgi:hypothetical protein
MTYHYTILMLVSASIFLSLFHVSTWSAYSNLIDIKIEKLYILLVSYLKNKEVKFPKSIIVFCLKHQKSVAMGPKWLQQTQCQKPKEL